MKFVALPGGMGAWQMGDAASRRAEELAALRLGLDAGLARLGTDRIDLYLLHWRGAAPLAELDRLFPPPDRPRPPERL